MELYAVIHHFTPDGCPLYIGTFVDCHQFKDKLRDTLNVTCEIIKLANVHLCV